MPARELVIFFAAWLPLQDGGEPWCDVPDACQIVTAAGVPVLPEAIRSFFAERLAGGGLGATALTSIPGTGPTCDDSRFLMLDVAARDGDYDARRAVAAAFPRSRGDAQQHFKKHQERHGGELPWAAGDRFQQLVSAFGAGDGEAIARESSLLFCLATDAALPFNTTCDREGPATRRFDTTDAKFRSDAIHRTPRRRCQSALIQAYRPRFECEVRVWPGRFQAPADPVHAVFDVMLEAHGALEELDAIERRVWVELEIADPSSFAGRADAYYRRMAELAGPITEERLEAGALLGANLVGAAWIRAGSPPAERFTSVAGPIDSPEQPAAEAPEAELVGSRNSKVFHRATCPHAKRIQPEHRVSFASVEQALAAGRRACATCRPDTAKE